MKKPDPYDMTRQLINDLLLDGQTYWSSKLTDALYSGSTGTEILGEIRLCLRELGQSETIAGLQ
ncbi:MAG: hypothetical protein AAGU11_21380, partial [Syntrophobacteraceae bacterium]